MSIKAFLIDFWDNQMFDGINRKALKRYVRASKIYHKGGRFNEFIALLMNRRNTRAYGCNIYPSAKLGDGLYIPHFVGIVIGSTTHIGRNCTIFPGVVFGAAYSPNKENRVGRRHPKCGDNCVFGANSSIIGDITIGNNVTVGAGAIITKDVPDNATVVGNNRIIGYKNDKEL